MACLIVFLIYPVRGFSNDNFDIDNDPVSVFTRGSIRSLGISAPGQDETSAYIVAETDAQRNLLSMTSGTLISSFSSVQMGTLIEDAILSRVDGFLKNAVSCGKSYDAHQGYATVCLEIRLQGIGGLYHSVYPHIIDSIDTGTLYLPAQELENPSEQEQYYNGLIVDVRNFPEFIPSFVNRIFNPEGNLVYSPTMVLRDILFLQGPANFTTSSDETKRMIVYKSISRPLWIQAAKLKAKTDLIINSDDAETICQNNLKTDIFKNARVIFIVNH